jgi:hypothetical protein
MVRAQFENWSDLDLIEYWLERVAIRVEGTNNVSASNVIQCEYLAATELKKAIGVNRLPEQIRTALRKFRK